MPKIEVEIEQANYDILEQIAMKLGLPVDFLIQQEVDNAVLAASVWLQRAE
jgi:hypothetical protein